MTTRPIELGLHRTPDGQSPTPWQIHLISTILAGLTTWSADPDSPRTTDFQTRVERLRKTLVAGMSSHELADTVERVLQLCDTYFADTRTILTEREKELASVVQVLRETLADLAGQAKSFNVDLMRSTNRIGTLAHVDDIRELKRLIASEARELKNAVVEKQRRDDVLFTQMSKRVDALQTQLAEAQKQAELDPLTEIANRRGFDRAIKEWACSPPSRSSPSRWRWSTSTTSRGSTTPTATRSAIACCSASRSDSSTTPATTSSWPASAARSSRSCSGRRRWIRRSSG